MCRFLQIFLWTSYILFGGYLAKAQSIRSFQKSWQKGYFLKTKQTLNKYLTKDSLNAVALYLYGEYYLLEQHGEYDLDKAHYYALALTETYFRATDKALQRYQKAGLTYTIVNAFKQKTDSLGFAVALSKNTEAAFQYFIDHYPTALEVEKAISLRDSIGFAHASRLHTYQAYFDFMRKYPQAKQIPIAKQHYETLLYEFETNRKTLMDYERFVKQYPQSPYRQEAEKKLYHLFTADNLPETLEKFLKLYPDNIYATRAWWRLWFLSTEKELFLEKYPNCPIYAQARKLMELDTTTFITFIQQNKFGFIDTKGQVRFEPILQKISDDYLCSTLETDYIISIEENKAGIYDRTGRQIAKPDYEDIYPFGKQAVKVMKNDKFGLYHKGGFELIPCLYEQLEYIDNQVIQTKSNLYWGIITYQNDTLIPFELDKIIAEKNGAILLQKEKKWAITNNQALLRLLQNPKQKPTFDYDSVASSSTFGETYLKVWKDGKINLYDPVKLEEVSFFPRTPEGNSQLFLYESLIDTRYGWIGKKDSFYTLHCTNGNYFDKLEHIINGTYHYAIRKDKKWGIISPLADTIIPLQYDSVEYLGYNAFILHQNGKKWGYFSQPELIDLSGYKRFIVQSILSQSSDKPKFLIIVEDRFGKKGVINQAGELIIKPKYSDLTVVNDTIFRAELGGKKGLISLNNKIIVPFEFEGITYQSSHHHFALLASKKFGTYHLISGKLIKPKFDAVLKNYNDTLLVAKQNKLGFINLSGNTISNFEFDDIQYWNDTSALVLHQEKWKIYLIQNRRFTDDIFESYKILIETDSEKTITTYRSSGYGLLSNQKGRLLPEAYSQIYNIGSPQKPFYWVESHVQRTEIYVVLFVNEHGEIVRKDILTPEEYEKLACND